MHSLVNNLTDFHCIESFNQNIVAKAKIARTSVQDYRISSLLETPRKHFTYIIAVWSNKKIPIF